MERSNRKGEMFAENHCNVHMDERNSSGKSILKLSKGCAPK